MSAVQDIVNNYMSAMRLVDAHVKEQYPSGSRLEWIKGPYKFRACQVVSTTWDVTSKGELRIYLFVKTLSRKPGKTFVDSRLDKVCHPANHFQKG